MSSSTCTGLVALAGNPNTGKTSLFNRLTGLRHKVGNYPGITVDRVTGELSLPSGPVVLADVPGTYSLSARSEEEHIAIRAIAGLPPHEHPDAVVVVVDATQLSRNLYLALQVIELGVPTLVALNMTDMLASLQRKVDPAALSSELGVPVLPISAKTGQGCEALREAVDEMLRTPESCSPGARWEPNTAQLRADVQHVAQEIPAAWHAGQPARARSLALWALLSLDDQDELRDIPAGLRAAVRDRRRAASEAGRDLENEIVGGRYAWIDERLASFQQDAPEQPRTWTDRVDRLLLHPLLGFTLFLLMMGLVFQSLFAWSDPAIGLIESAFGWLQGAVEGALPAGLFSELIVNGLIEGVGAVLVFLPQILLLFFFIGLMEDTGYLARVAYLMDRIMKSIGLHGRAFVPMLSGFACAVPAILATRTMERRRDRMLTMMVVPLMTCSARLPVYTLLIAAFFATDARLAGVLPVQGGLMVAMYLFSTVVALIAAWVLGKTMLRGPNVPLLLEMPPYRVPHWPSVLRMMWTRSRLFITEAGTIILVCTIGMWALLSFPRTETSQGASVPVAIEQSYGGQLGHGIEPLIAPLGFDWKLGVGLIGAFAAREVFVSTMGVVYGLEDDVDEEPASLRESLQNQTDPNGKPSYTPLIALSLMVFFALACQCMSTLAVIKSETRSWGWTTFAFVYMTALAWIASFAIYQGGRLLGFA